MIREIVKDQFFLAQKSLPATEEDRAVGQDLLDTLRANREGCVGLAANMIGVKKCIIAFTDGETETLLYNPVILKGSGPYVTQEGCLSLPGQRKARRWKKIRLQFQNESFQVRVKTYEGYTAQIIQHELDHCAGILI